MTDSHAVIKYLLVARDVLIYDPEDATLFDQWSRFDGVQQRRIVEALEASTVMTEEAES